MSIDQATDIVSSGAATDVHGSARQDAHPTLTPVGGFLAGIGFVTLLPAVVLAGRPGLLGEEPATALWSLLAVSFAAPAALIVPRPTRRFGAYALLGGLVTWVIVVAMGALALWLMLEHHL